MAGQGGSVASADVVVCGGGVAGCMAAVAAARAGAQVVLVERYGFLGGNATAGAVAQFNSWQTAAGRRVVAGLADEVVQRLRAIGGAAAHEVFTMSTGHRMDRVTYAPELLKLVLDEMVLHSGVTPLLHTQLLDVDRDGRRVTALRVLNKGGVGTLGLRVLVDASGDLDALHRAGAGFLPLDEGESLQPATLMFRFGPVDFSSFDALAAAERQALAARGHGSGELARAALHAAREPGSDDAWFNIGRLAVDATDPWALSRAEMEGRRQAWSAAQFLQREVPGCAAGRLRAFGTQVGVRESRRVQGDHVLTADDLLRPAVFDDAVACGAYPIDIHRAQGGGLDYRELGADHAYAIPLRCLLPAALDNALVVGRGVSASHAAQAAVRVMTISMAMGHAAGVAAALSCAAADAPAMPRQVDRGELRQSLREQGAVLP